MSAKSPLPPMPENAPRPVSPPLQRGDPVPWFRIASDVNDKFQFSSLGGRRLVLSFLPSLSKEPFAATVAALQAAHAEVAPGGTVLGLFTLDPDDRTKKIPETAMSMRYFFDVGGAVSQLFGAFRPGEPPQFLPLTFVVDVRLRVAAVVPMTEPQRHAADVLAALEAVPLVDAPREAVLHAPVLIVPNVFEPELCARLIEGYEKAGGQDSGYMVERAGKTVLVVDHHHKRRADWDINDDMLRQACRARVVRRLVPEIARAFQFNVTRMERYLVACYSAEDAGHFNAHRDNTTKGTAHRRFAVSINLNSEAYDGGHLAFPEFGRARFRPPTGGACVFSCSLLHEAQPVTRGRRYVFVPFLYDDAAAAIRDANLGYLDVPARAT